MQDSLIKILYNEFGDTQEYLDVAIPYGRTPHVTMANKAVMAMHGDDNFLNLELADFEWVGFQMGFKCAMRLLCEGNLTLDTAAGAGDGDDALAGMGVIPKKGNLDAGTLYRWTPPYLIVPANATPEHLKKAITHLITKLREVTPST